MAIIMGPLDGESGLLNPLMTGSVRDDAGEEKRSSDRCRYLKSIHFRQPKAESFLFRVIDFYHHKMASTSEPTSPVLGPSAPAAAHASSPQPENEPEPVPGNAIEVANEAEDDDEFAPSDYGSDGGSDSASLTSSVYAHTYENGRRYHTFRNGRYPIPNDDVEQNREDMKHAMMLELTDGKLHMAPINENPEHIIGERVATFCKADSVFDSNLNSRFGDRNRNLGNRYGRQVSQCNYHRS